MTFLTERDGPSIATSAVREFERGRHAPADPVRRMYRECGRGGVVSTSRFGVEGDVGGSVTIQGKMASRPVPRRRWRERVFIL